jgi:hypothetical protein
MITFFKHIGIGIISAFTAFVGAFHSAPTQVTPPITPTEVVATTSINSKDVSVVEPKPTTVTTKQKEAIVTPVATPPAVVPSPTPIQTPVQTTEINYSAYESLPSDFSKNPPYYIGTKVKITGRVSDFMAAGDRGGSSNYIEIIPQSIPLSYFALEIDSSANYHDSVSTLNTSDIVTAYGIISASQNFLTTNNTGSNSMVLMPVVNLARLDKCTDTTCTINPGVYTIFPYFNVQKDITPLLIIYENPTRFLVSTFITRGKVIKIVNLDSGNSLVFIQDQNDGRGIASFVIETSVLVNGNVKIGAVFEVTGVMDKYDSYNIYNSYNIIAPLSSVPFINISKYSVVSY